MAGFVLGGTFLGMQIFIEYPHALDEFTPQTNAYGSLYFTLTGFHGAHVAGGLLMAMWVIVRAWQGAYDERRHTSVQNFAMYWHFVDIVWLFVLLTIFVSPYL
jgi:cytochrome c oxidase subunit III